MPTNKKTKGRAVPATAAALAAAAAASVAGYYFYGTKKAKKHRQAASKWAKGMKQDVEKGVKSLKKIDSKTVARIVDDAAAAYQGVRGVAAGDVRVAARELKQNWSRIAADMAPSVAVKRAVQGMGKKMAKKKTTKKVAPGKKKVGKKKGAKKKAPKKSHSR